MIDIEIDLPIPISVNAIWRSNRGGVHRSEAYAKWQKEADALLLSQRGWRNKKITGKFTALLLLNERMMNQSSDGDNFMKAPLDYAKRIGLIVDDSIKYARQWTIKLGDDESAPCGARLILRSVETADQPLKLAKPPARTPEIKATAAARASHIAQKSKAAPVPPRTPKPAQRATERPPAASPIAVPPVVKAEIVARNGIKVDLGRLKISKGSRSYSMDDEQTALMATLLRVMPALLPADRIAPKVFGYADTDSSYRLGVIVDRLNPSLSNIGLKIRSVPKIGFALGDL